MMALRRILILRRARSARLEGRTDAPRGWTVRDLAALTVIAVGVAFRLVHLGAIPGINGDEAWYVVQGRQCRPGATRVHRITSP